MTEPWSPERTVEPALARELIEAQFPDLAPARLEPFGAGYDNTVYLVNGEWVFRFPRRSVAVACLEHELLLLPAMAPRLPLPVPVPARAGRPDAAYPWPFAGHRLLAGRTADAAAPPPAARAAAAAPLGRFLAALHALPTAGAPGDTIARADVSARAPRARSTLAALRAIDDPLRGALARVIDETPADLARPAPVLVHGDLYARHLLLDAEDALAGVIDWGDVHAGDRALDLAIAFTFLPPPARGDLFAAYGAVDEPTLRLARFRAVYHSANILRYAESVGDRPLVEEMRRALEGVVCA